MATKAPAKKAPAKRVVKRVVAKKAAPAKRRVKKRKPVKRIPTWNLPGKPFTTPHFKAWAAELELDTEDKWHVEDFQTDFVEDLFAGFLEAWLVVAEGNGKTTLLAGIALYHCQFKRSAGVPVGASSRDQAELLYGQAEGLVLRNPKLAAIFKCLPGYRIIRCASMGSKIKIYAADERTGDGIIPTLCIVEELHRHRDLKLYRTWRGKVRKRKGQIVAISTAGEPGSEFEQTRERIRESAPDVQRRTCFTRAASRTIVLHDWAVPEKANVEDLEVVKAANPFSGVTIETLREDRESPTMTLQHWRRFKCNLPTRSVNSAVTEVEWDAAKTAERIPAGEPIDLGVDIGWKWDSTALVPLWIRTVRVKAGEECGKCDERVAHGHLDPHFRLFGPAVILTPPRNGDSLNPDEVERALREINERNPIRRIVMDITRAEQLAVWCHDELGVPEVREHSQGNAQAAIDYDRFMEALRSGWLKHTGDRGLARHVFNAVARMLPDGHHKFERVSTTRQGGDQEVRIIDALVAGAMVHSDAAAEIAAGEAEPLVAWGR